LTEKQAESSLLSTSWGLELIDEELAALLRTTVPPLGKLLQYKQDDEITQNDGRDGRPLWITIGVHVYDISGTMAQRPEFPLTQNSTPPYSPG